MRRWALRIVTAVGALLGVLLLLILIVELHYSSKLYHDLPSPRLPSLPAVTGLASSAATTCAACHPQIASEWLESAHARAATSSLYLASFHHEKEFYFCTYCHTPLVEQRPTIV